MKIGTCRHGCRTVCRSLAVQAGEHFSQTLFYCNETTIVNTREIERVRKSADAHRETNGKGRERSAGSDTVDKPTLTQQPYI